MKNKSIDFDSIFTLESREAVDSWRGVVGVDDFDDEQPSVKEIFSGEVKSPSALEGSSGVYGDFQLVGHGQVTNDKCGTFRKVVGCTYTELHDKAIFDKKGALVNCTGKGYFKPYFHSCDKPSCPVCYERGWAIRQAGNIEFRLEQASKHFGLAEHIIISVPVKDYDLSYGALRHKVDKVLKSRGVICGVKIFHGFRFDKLSRSWHFSPHFHILGFIYGGYGKCRNCKRKWNCLKGCGGFDDRNYHDGFLKDGYVVKVKDKRKTIFGTAWYQLHHSSIDVSKKRFHVATWFGVTSYHKLQISKELRKEYDRKHRPKCPICGLPLVRHDYCGHKENIIALFSKRRGARESVEGFFDTASDWVEMPEWDSESYEN